MRPRLQAFSRDRGLYLDVPGRRPGVRKGKKIRWADDFGNEHDLDFVIERDGSLEKQGRPVAFIEAAWRRYTRHSRNKAQEIQGALLPIAERHCWDKPFLGAILAGKFTGASVQQLQSLGFHVLHIPYSTIVHAFSEAGVVASYDEATPDAEFQERVKRIEKMGRKKAEMLERRLVDQCEPLIAQFLDDLGQALDRMVESVTVLPLVGTRHQFKTISEAVSFVDGFDREDGSVAFQKYEVFVKYSNGDRIDGSFAARSDAKRFLAYVAG